MRLLAMTSLPSPGHWFWVCRRTTHLQQSLHFSRPRCVLTGSSSPAWLTDQQNISPTSEPYISAVASNCVTISGPPASLEHLLNSTQFSGLKAIHTSVYAAYHADHIYTLKDVDTVLSKGPLTSVRSCTDAIPVFSNATGKMHSTTEHTALLHTIISEILTEQIRWDRIVEEVSANVIASHASVCEILSFGGNATHSLISGLSQDGAPVIEAKEDVWSCLLYHI